MFGESRTYTKRPSAPRGSERYNANDTPYIVEDRLGLSLPNPVAAALVATCLSDGFCFGAPALSCLCVRARGGDCVVGGYIVGWSFVVRDILPCITKSD